MRITISGQSGTNKTEIARILAKKLNLKHYSIVEHRKKMAEERNVTLAKLNKIGEIQDFTDKQVDEFQAEMGKKEKNLIVDGKLSYYFIPESTKIYLKSHVRIRAERSYNKEKELHKYRDTGDAIAAIIEREKSDMKRYQKYYKINPTNELQYDLIINNSHENPDETVKQILEFLEKEILLKSQ